MKNTNSKQKSLVERLAKNASNSATKKSFYSNQVVFLNNLEDIKQALAVGWRAKNIWEQLYNEGIFTSTYSCFTVYLRKFIYNEDNTNQKTISIRKIQENTTITPEKESTDIVKVTKPPETFTYNAEPLKDDDLY